MTHVPVRVRPQRSLDLPIRFGRLVDSYSPLRCCPVYSDPLPCSMSASTENSVATIANRDLPCERSPSVQVVRGSAIELRTPGRSAVIHRLSHEAGWAHLSVLVSSAFACQIDCVVSQEAKFDPTAITQGRATGVRFQPSCCPEQRTAMPSCWSRFVLSRSSLSRNGGHPEIYPCHVFVTNVLESFGFNRFMPGSLQSATSIRPPAATR